jgi:hypothetical protein
MGNINETLVALFTQIDFWLTLRIFSDNSLAYLRLYQAVYNEATGFVQIVINLFIALKSNLLYPLASLTFSL